MANRLAIGSLIAIAFAATACSTSGAPASEAASLPPAASPAATPAPSASDGPPPADSPVPPDPDPSEPGEAAADGQDYRGSGASRTMSYSVAKCDGPTGGSWNVDIREASGGGAFTFYEIPEGADQAPAQVDYQMLLGDPENLNGTGTFVAGDPPHFVIENGEGTTDIALEVGSFCR
jgi:hypothetical protein